MKPFIALEYLHPQVYRSYKALIEALIELSLEHGYENLTVRGLTAYARVGYATFYRHFDSLDELLAYACQTVFTDLSQQIAEAETLYDEAVIIYRSVRDYPRLYRIYTGLPVKHPVRQTYIGEATQLFEARFQQREGTKVPFRVTTDIYLDTTLRLALLYLDNLDRYTPEQLASMHCDLLLKGTIVKTLTLREGWIAYPPDQCDD